jgi:penicillin-binding protein 1A
MRRRRFWNYPRPNKGVVQRWLPSWRIVVGSILGVGALGMGMFVSAYLSTTVPDDLDEVNQEATTVYYANGKVVGQFAEYKREKVELASLPDYVGNAVVASEDATFWTNRGIDPKGMVRALWNNLKGGGRQGASTLTQQYVERTRLDTTTSYAGKIREAIIAMKIARTEPKADVLEGYLNTIYWGRGMYGIETASKEYFGHPAAELTYSEAALLSGIIPSPVYWDPSVNLDQAKHRWERSITRMYEQGYITKEEYDTATFPEFKEKKEASNSQGGQRGYILEAVKKELTAGDDAQFTEEELETRGLKITTTLKPKLQNAAVEVAESLPEDANKNVRASIVSIDPRNGRVLALYGGADYVTQNLNTATMDSAQAGSTFKPFTLIGALEKDHELSETFDGNSPGRPVDPTTGEPWLDPEDGQPWEPDNFGFYDYGQIDLVEATANSVNSAYAQLNLDIGPETTAEVAHRAGIREASEIPPVPSNVLGTANVYPIDLARAYSTIAAQGYKTTPHLVQKVETLAGEQVYEEDTSQEKVFEADVMAATTYAMTKVVEEGSGEPAQELGRPVAGKTGTSQENKSAWFAGFIPQMTTVVGLRQYADLDVEKGIMKGSDPIDRFGPYEQITGGSWPVEAWTDFMQVATEGMDIEEFPEYTPPEPTFSPSPSPSPSESPALEWVDVPASLIGQDISRVTRELEKLGFVVGTPIAQPHEARQGTVLDISPIGQVPYGATITLTVSTGEPEQPAQVTVPDVTYQPQAAADATLQGSGFRTQTAEEYSNDVPVGLVIRTDPAAGSAVEEGATVTMVVSLGPETTEEPTDPGNGGGGGGNG